MLTDYVNMEHMKNANNDQQLSSSQTKAQLSEFLERT